MRGRLFDVHEVDVHGGSSPQQSQRCSGYRYDLFGRLRTDRFSSTFETSTRQGVVGSSHSLISHYPKHEDTLLAIV